MIPEKKKEVVIRFLRVMAEEGMTTSVFKEIEYYLNEIFNNMPITKEFIDDTDWEQRLAWIVS